MTTRPSLHINTINNKMANDNGLYTMAMHTFSFLTTTISACALLCTSANTVAATNTATNTLPSQTNTSLAPATVSSINSPVINPVALNIAAVNATTAIENRAFINNNIAQPVTPLQNTTPLTGGVTNTTALYTGAVQSIQDAKNGLVKLGEELTPRLPENTTYTKYQCSNKLKVKVVYSDKITHTVLGQSQKSATVYIYKTPLLLKNVVEKPLWRVYVAADPQDSSKQYQWFVQGQQAGLRSINSNVDPSQIQNNNVITECFMVGEPTQTTLLDDAITRTKQEFVLPKAIVPATVAQAVAKNNGNTSTGNNIATQSKGKSITIALPEHKPASK